jgi:hypothetical protein
MVGERAVADAETALADRADAGLSALAIEVGMLPASGRSPVRVQLPWERSRPRRLTLRLADTPSDHADTPSGLHEGKGQAYDCQTAEGS